MGEVEGVDPILEGGEAEEACRAAGAVTRQMDERRRAWEMEAQRIACPNAFVGCNVASKRRCPLLRGSRSRCVAVPARGRKRTGDSRGV